jgi:hypothetical protein
MNRVKKAEFANGYVFKKIIMAVVWLAWSALIIFSLLRFKGLYKSIQEMTIVIYLCEAVVFYLMCKFFPHSIFNRFWCIPVWGATFTLNQLKFLFENEHFEQVNIPGLPNVDNIYESERWLEIDRHFYLKPLMGTAEIYKSSKGADKFSSVPEFITGHMGSDILKLNVHSKEELKLLNQYLQQKVNPLTESIRKYPYDSSDKAFNEIWGNRPFRELADYDLNSLRKSWENLTYNVYFDINEFPEDDEDDEDDDFAF